MGMWSCSSLNQALSAKSESVPIFLYLSGVWGLKMGTNAGLNSDDYSYIIKFAKSANTIYIIQHFWASSIFFFWSDGYHEMYLLSAVTAVPLSII